MSKPMPREANPDDTSIIWHIVWKDDYDGRVRWIGGTYFQGYWGAYADVRGYDRDRERYMRLTPDEYFMCGHDFESTGCPYVDEMVD